MSAPYQPWFAAFLFSQSLPQNEAGVAKAKNGGPLILSYGAFLRSVREWAEDAVVFGAVRDREGRVKLLASDMTSACWIYAHAARGGQS